MACEVELAKTIASAAVESKAQTKNRRPFWESREKRIGLHVYRSSLGEQVLRIFLHDVENVGNYAPVIPKLCNV